MCCGEFAEVGSDCDDPVLAAGNTVASAAAYDPSQTDRGRRKSVVSDFLRLLGGRHKPTCN